ncbi:MAG: hypothetical protein ABJJ05_10420 [Maribacter litoralis]|uniref:hypothetical protein n=1 Tax=Maribacter litoralis TaxID=2059726 RepID=UPI003298E183
MKGICELYKTEEELRKSHIHPKFAVAYYKKTGSRFLRNWSNPNKRLQDAETHYLLSSKAEEEFSKREKWFSENIFKPYLEENRKVLNYDENLLYFTISYLWRTLVVLLRNKELDNHWGLKIILEAENEWRELLSNNEYPKKHNRFYLLLTDRIKHHTLDSNYVDFYFTRVMDFTTVSNENQTFLAVYAKFNKFIFWSVLKGGNEDQLVDVKINPIKGKINIPQQLEEQIILSFFLIGLIKWKIHQNQVRNSKKR